MFSKIVNKNSRYLLTELESYSCMTDTATNFIQGLYRTKTANVLKPVWSDKFELDEIGGGEYLKIKCYSEDTFTDDNIGSARVNLEGLLEGSVRDIWVPLEKVSAGELRLQVEAVKVDNYELSGVCI